MMLISLEDVIQFTLGKNRTRIDPRITDIYTPDNFEKDYIVSLHWRDQMNALLIL